MEVTTETANEKIHDFATTATTTATINHLGFETFDISLKAKHRLFKKLRLRRFDVVSKILADVVAAFERTLLAKASVRDCAGFIRIHAALEVLSKWSECPSDDDATSAETRLRNNLNDALAAMDTLKNNQSSLIQHAYTYYFLRRRKGRPADYDYDYRRRRRSSANDIVRTLSHVLNLLTINENHSLAYVEENRVSHLMRLTAQSLVTGKINDHKLFFSMIKGVVAAKRESYAPQVSQLVSVCRSIYKTCEKNAVKNRLLILFLLNAIMCAELDCSPKAEMGLRGSEEDGSLKHHRSARTVWPFYLDQKWELYHRLYFEKIN